MIIKLDMVTMPIIPALGGLKQEDYKFEARHGYIERSCLK